MGDQRNAHALKTKMQRVDSLVDALERCPDARARDNARELVGTLMEFHGTAIARMMEILAHERPDQESLIHALGKDPVTGSLLLLYGLHPADLESRVRDALEQVRPALRNHRGDVELLSIGENTVRLRLLGTCNGCRASTTTFKNLIEEAIYDRAPEVEAIEVEGMAAQ
jgi:Fe-S cluster biogenesis protein NfuA